MKKEKLITKLIELSDKHPQLRLCQLISCIVEQDDVEPRIFFHISDEDFYELMEDFEKWTDEQQN